MQGPFSIIQPIIQNRKYIDTSEAPQNKMSNRPRNHVSKLKGIYWYQVMICYFVTINVDLIKVLKWENEFLKLRVLI